MNDTPRWPQGGDHPVVGDIAGGKLPDGILAAFGGTRAWSIGPDALAADWHALAPVDIVVADTPCLWDSWRHTLAAIDSHRPRLVVVSEHQAGVPAILADLAMHDYSVVWQPSGAPVHYLLAWREGAKRPAVRDLASAGATA